METDTQNKSPEFVLDLTEEHSTDFIRKVQITMPRGAGVKQFELKCRFRHGTQSDIDDAVGDVALMEEKLVGWSPALKVIVEDDEGNRAPRELTSDHDLEENRKHLLSIPWLRAPILNSWIGAILGGNTGGRKRKNS